MNKDGVKFKLWEVLVITIVATVFMSLTTGYLVYRKFNSGTVSNTNNKYVNEFIKAYNDVVDNYYEEVDEDKVIDAAINGMMSYLGDDYTTYLDNDDTDALNEKLAGTYEGIGVTILNNEEGNIVVKSVINNSSAQSAGILAGDIISSVNGESVLGKDASELTSFVSKNNDAIRLGVIRDNENLEFSVEKRELIIPALSSEVKVTPMGNKVGYLYLSSFTSSLGVQVAEEIAKFESENISNLIIDLRGNSGGYLKSATDILEMFLEKNDLMFSLQYKDDKVDYKDETDESKNYKIAIIVNNGSASASEVLAAALKDHNKAVIIGETTYGKGKVQMTGELEDGSMYKYTSAKWLRPNGNCIDEVGIEPDIKVSFDNNYLNNPIVENDNQLNTAINYFDN